jgi:hypothetical protein
MRKAKVMISLSGFHCGRAHSDGPDECLKYYQNECRTFKIYDTEKLLIPGNIVYRIVGTCRIGTFLGYPRSNKESFNNPDSLQGQFLVLEDIPVNINRLYTCV